MKVLSSKDYLEVTANSLIADYDRDILTNLYQPIFGYTALSVYFSLWSEMNNQKVTSISTHEQFLARMQMPTGVFVDARKSLEACGLLRTYVEAAGEVNVYTYELYAPKTPKLFFDNALLYGMLIKCIGENEAKRLKSIYKIDNENEFGEEISAHFHEVFHPEFDDPAFMIAAKSASDSIGRNSSKIKGEFSYETFFNSLNEISQIKEDAFTKKDMKELERIATLYGVDEMVAANTVASIYNPTVSKGKRIDFVKLTKLFQDETNFAYLSTKNYSGVKNLVSGKTDLAYKINMMETKSPKDYLSILQNGTKPAGADLRLIDDLSKNFNLNNSVINVIVDFILSTNNNILSRALSEKIAASIAREGIETAVDAMNYLKKVSKPKGQRKQTSNIKVENDAVEEKQPENKKEKDEPSWEQLLDELGYGGNDGKD